MRRCGPRAWRNYLTLRLPTLQESLRVFFFHKKTRKLSVSMAQTKQTLLLLDGNALLHRAWHAIPPLTTKDGRVVNAAYGFAMTLDKMLGQFKPDYMVVAWDLPGKTFRHEKFEAYKAQRKEKEPELYAQIPLIQEILTLYGIPSVSAEGYEADDVIGTLSKKAGEKKLKTLVVTGDQDQMQLVDENTTLVYFLKGISETKLYDPTAVVEKYGFTPLQMIDYKALRGDPSDNIPGVKGIGEKGAKELIAQFGSVKSILKARGTGTIKPTLEKKLVGQDQVTKDSLELVTIVRDVPLAFDFEKAKVGVPDLSRLISLYRDLEFRSLIRKLTPQDQVKAPPVDGMNNEFLGTFPPSGGTPPTPPSGAVPLTAVTAVVVPSGRNDVTTADATKVAGKGKIQIIRGSANVSKALETIKTNTIAVVFVEQTPDLFGATMAAVAISDGERIVVIPNPNAELLELVKANLDQASRIVTHDWKRIMHLTGWEADSKVTDLMIASYLLSSGTRTHDLGAIVTDVTVPVSFATDKDLTTLGSIVRELPKIAVRMEEELERSGMTKIFRDVELPLIPVLYKMEKAGILLDTTALDSFSKKLEVDLNALTEKIQQLAGMTFNVNSPSQLADVLFSKLNLPPKGIKKTTTGYSTAASELEKLEDTHEIIPLISEFREKAKLQSTYAEALPKLVGKDGCIHTTFNQTIAATGRLSSVDPNLQNIPIKTELGNEIRKAFIAEKGKVLIAADYSQIELRLVAVMANDKPFIDAFNAGADIHTRTASEVWDVPEKEVTFEQRRAAKAINFGIVYGMGPRSLARSTNMSVDEAKAFIDRYFSIHHAVKTYIDETKHRAHADGFAVTMFGRRRGFPEINSGIQMLVAMAERMAVNMPIQGTQADIVKMAMIAVDGWLTTSKWPAKMLLQVHDELVFECDDKAVDAVAGGVKKIMEEIVSLSVPLVVNVKVGKNWGEMEKI